MSNPPTGKKLRAPKAAKATGRMAADAQFDAALAASLANRHDEAIGALTRVLQAEPSHARARHLLGAEYAQIGKIAEAVIEMSVALELDPNQTLARFQLGLLLLTSGKLEQAETLWKALDALGPSHTLNLFKNGMLYMAKGDFPAARLSLNAALAENIELPVLNNEIATALRALDQAQFPPADAARPAGATAPAEADAAPESAETDDSHILVSTYGGSNSTH
ncbi:MAG TPA: hypothetical protein VF472_00185 [Burkholderiaceae bacterium]